MTGLVTKQVSGSNSGLRDALVGADLPIDDLNDGGTQFFRYDLDGRTVGYGGFEPHGMYALVRSVVVLPEVRGKGMGRAVAKDLFTRAAQAGCAEAFLLTTTAADFFERLGFKQMDRTYAPKAILATKQASTICSTAALLSRLLND